MKKDRSFLNPSYEEHATLFCDGLTLHADGFRSGPDALSLPPFYESGLCAVFNLLEKMLPGLKGISVMGIFTEEESAPFIAWDLMLITGDDNSFFLPMERAASLFSQNGIPYYHRP